MSLLQWGNFTLHSGENSWWRIDCDAFTDSEIALIAKLMLERIPNHYGKVLYPESHPGSVMHKLAAEMRNYIDEKSNNILIVDDVLTIGNSMRELYFLSATYGAEIFGAVIFARGLCPSWVKPIFQMPS